MLIKPIASSSKGNCCVIDDGRSKLILDCGIPIKKIKEGVDFNLSNIAGCLISHSHL